MTKKQQSNKTSATLQVVPHYNLLTGSLQLCCYNTVMKGLKFPLVTVMMG